MFLVTFVTLVVSIIALFAQVLSLQTARLNAAQVGLSQTMIAWHGAAVTGVKNNIPTNMSGMTGCSLIANPSFALCAPNTMATYLPPGYQAARYSFYSVAFQSPVPTVTYVVTYVPPPTSYAPAALASSDLFLPGQGGFDSGYSIQSLSRQFTRSVPVYLAYGSVTSSTVLTVSAKSAGTSPGGVAATSTYSIPASVPVGSLAILSAAQ